MKKYLLFLPLLFVLSGCSNYTELNELNVVENLGIDYQNNEFRIVATTIEKKEEEYSYSSLTSSGKTLQEAIENIKVQEVKKLYIAHLNLLVLTSDAINQKLEEILSFFLQNTESRNDFSMAIADSIDFLKDSSKNQLKEMVQMIEKDIGNTRSIQFEDFLKDYLEQNFSYLPTIDTKEDIVVQSITLIENGKVSEHLTKEECLLLNLITNHIQKANIDQDTVFSNQTITHFKNKKMNITMNLILTTENEQFENRLEEKIQHMFDKYRKKNIDIFRFKKQIEISNNPFYQKHKKDLLDHIELVIDIKVKRSSEEKEEVLP